MVKKKNTLVYQKDDEIVLSGEELNRKLIGELIRRIDQITTDLYASDSEYVLSQIPEIKKRLENLAHCLAINDNELRIYRDIVSSLQRTIYPLAETYELQEMEKKIRLMQRKSS